MAAADRPGRHCRLCEINSCACILEKSSSRATWVRIKRAVRKASNFPKLFNGPSDGPVRDLDDYARCCTSFSTALLRAASCFICCAPCKRFLMPSHVCSSGHLTPAMSPPPRYTPYCPYASHGTPFPFRRSFCCVTIPSTETYVSHVPQRRAPNGSGSSLSAFQPLALSRSY